MPVTKLNPLSSDEGPLVTFTSTCVGEKKKKKPFRWETDTTQACSGRAGTVRCLKACTHNHMARLLLKVGSDAIKLIKLTLKGYKHNSVSLLYLHSNSCVE